MRVNGSKENQSDNEQIKFDNYYNLLFGRKKYMIRSRMLNLWKGLKNKEKTLNMEFIIQRQRS